MYGDTAHSRKMLLQIWIERYDPWAINSIGGMVKLLRIFRSTNLTFLSHPWKSYVNMACFHNTLGWMASWIRITLSFLVDLVFLAFYTANLRKSNRKLFLYWFQI